MERGRGVFTALWVFIIFVSVVDGYLVFEHRSSILSNEMNPLGRFLLFLNAGQVWYLLAIKFIGTGGACGLLLIIQRKNRRLGTAIAAAVAAFQFCLLLFLTLA